MFASNFMDSTLNILVCGLCFSGINHMDVMVLEGFLRMAFHTVSIKYQDQDTAFDALIIT